MPLRTRRPRRARKVLNRNDPHALAVDTGLPPAAVAKSVSPVAHRDLLGYARGTDHVCSVLELCLEATARAHAVPQVGLSDGAPCGWIYLGRLHLSRKYIMLSPPEPGRDSGGAPPLKSIYLGLTLLADRTLAVRTTPFFAVLR